jgi:glycosyltransferase involved in cell wall biosynthesis
MTFSHTRLPEILSSPMIASPGPKPETGTARPADSARPISVCLLISSLEFGGAERQVVEMMRTFDRTRIDPFVCSLSPNVPLAAGLPDREQCLHIVEKRGRFDLCAVFRVASLLRRRHVDVVHAFLFDSEIIARLAAPMAGVPVVISSERNTEYTRPLLHRIALKLTRPLFDVMVANSRSGKQFNVRTQGIDPSRIEVVHNGVDTDKFQPDPAAGEAFRALHGIPLGVPVVGMVASYKRQKGHDNFLYMAALVRQSVPEAHFLIVGGSVGDPEESRTYEAEVRNLCTQLGLGPCCHFLGNQKDMRAVYNACDLTALLSRREGTPNVVLESMACGVPAIASDIADNALIIEHGKSGAVVPVDNAAAAARDLAQILTGPGLLPAMRQAARERVSREFSLRSAAAKLESVYESCLAKERR